MAKMKSTPRTYAEAAEVLAGRSSMKLGNNTFLEKGTSLMAGTTDSPVIAVRLHNMYIVRFYQDGRVTLHAGGYHTVTTKERVNQFIDGRVYQENYQWYYAPKVNGRIEFEHPVIFGEGMNVGSTRAEN